jgi:hypothetical protein
MDLKMFYTCHQECRIATCNYMRFEVLTAAIYEVGCLLSACAVQSGSLPTLQRYLLPL